MKEIGDFQCKICGEDLTSFPSLHRHLKKEHGTSPIEYYPLFFDRRDKFDDELIPFKDVKSYFSTDFNSRYNLLKWAAKATDEVRDYILDLLVKRSEEKQTNLIPSHVELKSLFTPCLTDYLSIFGGKDKFCKALAENGLLMKLDSDTVDQKTGEFKIFIDTREQNPLPFANSEVKKLIVGDYCPDNNFFSNVFVERKSLYDFAGTMTKGLERFEKEINRASELGAYLVVVIESSFLDALEYSPKNSFSQKIGGAYLFNKVRKLMRENQNIQFVFSRNRDNSMKIIESIFRMGEAAKKTDLEFLKDSGQLK